MKIEAKSLALPSLRMLSATQADQPRSGGIAEEMLMGASASGVLCGTTCWLASAVDYAGRS